MITSFSGKYAFLSNFYPAPIKDFDYDITYPTVEHFFQATKTLNKPWRDLIAAAPTAGQAKRLGRQVPLRSDWEDIKVDIMCMGVRQKFSDPELCKMLLETGNETLIEGNTWHDKFWGACQCPICSGGANMLGKILMRVREEKKNESRII